MALPSTLYAFEVALSDVDRGVYETLEVRLARHPSESEVYLATRLCAYCLSYEPGIAFSKGGLSSDEPTLVVRDALGNMRLWIEVGAPSAERLHKASKAAPRVQLYASQLPPALKKAGVAGDIHRAAEIEVLLLPSAVLAALTANLTRRERLELVRSDGRLYLTRGAAVTEGALERTTLGGE